MKKLLKIFIPIIIFSIIARSFVVFLLPKVTFKDMHVLERGITYNAMDFVIDTNGDVIPESNTLYTDDVGRYDFVYRVKKGLFEQPYTFSYEVEDTTAPIITIKENQIIKEPREKYTEEDILKNVSINEGTMTIETDYDPVYSGTYHVNIFAEDDYGNMSSASYEVVVKDIEAPIIFKTADGLQVLRGSDFNLYNYIGYGDNADPNPVLDIKGTLNINRVGKYPLRGTVTDASGNVKEWDFTVEVVNKMPKDDTEKVDYLFEDFIKDYKQDDRKLGIDVSEWQDEIDFEAIKKAGCEFVFMRIGFSHDGNLTLDKEFRKNIEGAKKVGLPVGIYLFCYESTEEELKSTLNQIFEELDGTTLELPIVFDWEDFGRFNKYGFTFQDLNKLYDVFRSEVEAHGYKSMLYSSKFYLDRIWVYTDVEPTWLAQYTDWPSYKGSYDVWQLSDSGVIDGIDAYVDLDIMFTNSELFEQSEVEDGN